MKIFPLNKDTITLSAAFIIVIGFFMAGILNVLDYFIIKFILFTGFGVLVIYAIANGAKNEKQKNRPKA